MVAWTYPRAAKCLEAIVAEAELGGGGDLPTLRQKTKDLLPIFLRIAVTPY
jgi:hypothetical protein